MLVFYVFSSHYGDVIILTLTVELALLAAERGLPCNVELVIVDHRHRILTGDFMLQTRLVLIIFLVRKLVDLLVLPCDVQPLQHGDMREK